MPWSLLAGAIPYLIAAAIGGRVAWGIQSVRIDGLQGDIAGYVASVARLEGERDNWREVAAACGAATQRLEADSARRLAKAAQAAQAATAELVAAESALAAWRLQGAAGAAGKAETCDQVIARFQELGR